MCRRQISLDNVTPPAVSPGCAGLGDGVDSDWIKTVRVESALLGDFWQRPVTLEACVLVRGGALPTCPLVYDADSISMPPVTLGAL